MKIPYGKGYLNFSLPSPKLLGILQNPSAKTEDPAKLLEESLDSPLDGYGLEDKVAYKRRVLVVVPDNTRKAHLNAILPGLLRRIERRGRRIDIIVATGLHKKHDKEDLKELLGGEIVRRHNVICHEQDSKNLVKMGLTKNKIPIVLNKNVLDHDFIITLGVIEPHLYAGYSGGPKTVAIGLSGAETINVTHGVKFLDNPLTRIGSISGNPFQRALNEIAAKAQIGYAINIVNSPDGNAIKIFSGKLSNVFAEGAAYAKSIFEVAVAKQSAIVICGIGYPKDINLYQTSRAINYILNDRPILRKGGCLIIVAELKDGYGESHTEKIFYELLKSMSTPQDFVANVRRRGCVAGEHRAYMVAKGMLDYNITFAGKGMKKFMDGLPIPYFENISSALSRAERTAGKYAKIYVVPRALSTIARLKK